MGSFVPIPWENIIIQFVNYINSGQIGNPHTERTIGVDGIFLEISIHFVGV
jgi:hypothetical protein